MMEGPGPVPLDGVRSFPTIAPGSFPHIKTTCVPAAGNALAGVCEAAYIALLAEQTACRANPSACQFRN